MRRLIGAVVVIALFAGAGCGEDDGTVPTPTRPAGGGGGSDAGAVAGDAGGATIADAGETADQWSGRYIGTASQSGTCSDGSTVPPRTDPVDLFVTKSGSLLTMPAQCGATLTADIVGDVANVRQTSCPAVPLLGGGTSTVTVTGGTIRVNGRALDVRLFLSTAVMLPTNSGTCAGAYIATGTRQ